MDLRFYLFILALYLLYENRNFFEVIKGRDLGQLAEIYKQELLENIEGFSSISNGFYEKKKVWYICILIMVLDLLIEVSYFAMAVYFIRNPIFLGFSAICIIFWLWQLPGVMLRFLTIIRDTKNIHELEICRGSGMWLREAIFSTHAIIVIIMLANAFLVVS